MATRLITADTSVVVAGLTSWHEQHAQALTALRGVTRLPAHVLLESVSVLTRLPRGRAIPVAAAVARLRAEFPDDPMTLAPGQHVELLDDCARVGVVGGAVYDALVGRSAHLAGAVLRSRDRRAATTYASLGVVVDMVAG